MDNNEKIKVGNVKKSFDKNVVIKDISFSVKQGKSFVVMGGSGTGKSVLIKSIIGLIVPDAGSKVFIDGEDITFLSMAKRSRFIDKFGVLFQGGALFDSLSVWENITFSLLQKGNITKKQAKDLAVEKLLLVGMDVSAINLFPVELSGGMQKRVALARSIVADPEIIFFDEPTAGLDPIMSGIISNLIADCSEKLAATTVTITHDMNCARIIADEAALIYRGEFIWRGKGNELNNSDNPYLDQFIHGKPNGPMSS
jgi:phospholipid/cholesterol/gamma-HCH transport system ATP-binding protein